MHRSNIALVVCKQTFVDIVYLFRGAMRRAISLVRRIANGSVEPLRCSSLYDGLLEDWNAAGINV
jgi:hypothetical protein